MIEPHDEQIHRGSMLMPLLFASYENYVWSSKSFHEGWNWMEDFNICQKPTKYGQSMFCEVVKVDLENSKETSFKNTITSTLSLSSLCYLKIYLKPSPSTGISVVKKWGWNHQPNYWIKPIRHLHWWGQCTPRRIVVVVWGFLYLWLQGILQKFALHFDDSEQDHTWK